MNDRELLELAAKAAGIKHDGCTDWKNAALRIVEPEFKYWSPLTDDGDALRLAVKLGMDIELLNDCVYAIGTEEQNCQNFEWHDGDKLSATRRAIVRAAAEIGKAMQ